jgi:hypothetical protein
MLTLDDRSMVKVKITVIIVGSVAVVRHEEDWSCANLSKQSHRRKGDGKRGGVVRRCPDLSIGVGGKFVDVGGGWKDETSEGRLDLSVAKTG